MNNNIKYLLAFIAGAGVGAGITYKLVKTAVETKAQMDISAVRDYYCNLENIPDEDICENVSEEKVPEIEAEKAKNKPDISEYAKILSKKNYTNYSNSKDISYEKAIEYIDPSEFGNEPGFDEIFLDYYQDGVLVEEEGDVIDDFVSIVGNFTTHFNEFEEGVVCVKNNERKAYYQISIDYRNYKDLEEDGE